MAAKKTPATLSKEMKKFLDAQNIDFLAHNVSKTPRVLLHKFIVDPDNGLDAKVADFEEEDLVEMDAAIMEAREERIAPPKKK